MVKLAVLDFPWSSHKEHMAPSRRLLEREWLPLKSTDVQNWHHYGHWLSETYSRRSDRSSVLSYVKAHVAIRLIFACLLELKSI